MSHLKRTNLTVLIFVVVILLTSLFLTFRKPQPPVETPEETPKPTISAVVVTPVPTPTPVPATTVAQTTIPETEPETTIPLLTSMPIQIEIPFLSVVADIVPTEYDPVVNSMAIYPDASILSWYHDSSIPGNPGNAILAGHNSWKRKAGTLVALDTLPVGAECMITLEDETKVEFRLESVFVYYLPTAPSAEIMEIEGETRLTMITCKTPFSALWHTSRYRIVATFKPAEGFEIPDPPIEQLPDVEWNTRYPPGG
jgi:hypothetical protein